MEWSRYSRILLVSTRHQEEQMRTPSPVIELLRTVPGLGALDDRTLSCAASCVDETNASPGDVLMREGTMSRQALIVLGGEARVYVDGEHVATVGPGEFIGEMGMLENQPRSATVRAETSMRLLVIGPR